MENTVALGERRGQRVARLGEPGDSDDPPDGSAVRCHARWAGFDLDASHVVPAGARMRLERLCRYVLRPAVVSERVHRGDDGQVVWRLPRPWRDGTTHVRFDPCDFLGRLAVLVPRPRVNLLFYYGVLGARSGWRRSIVPGRAGGAGEAPAGAAESAPNKAPTPRSRHWAELMRRSFGFDVLACDRCGGRLRLIALIQHAEAPSHPDTPRSMRRGPGAATGSFTAAGSGLRRQLTDVQRRGRRLGEGVCSSPSGTSAQPEIGRGGRRVIRAVSRIRRPGRTHVR